MKILAFAGSSSRKSINRQFVNWVGSLFTKSEVIQLDLNDFEMPIFSVDKEEEVGQPEKAKAFIEKLGQADLIILSLAEHNGSYSAAFKNILDWASRINGKLFQNKPLLLMATSPGARGGQSVLESAKVRFPFLGADIKDVFSLPEFSKNFVPGQGIVNEEYKNKILKIVETLKNEK